MWFKLVDALELFTNLHPNEEEKYMSGYFALPKVNYYVPPRHNILKKPDFADPEKDDLGLRFATKRVSPFLVEDGLKATDFVGPMGTVQKDDSHMQGNKFLKYRRISHAKNRKPINLRKFFSTAVSTGELQGVGEENIFEKMTKMPASDFMKQPQTVWEKISNKFGF